MRKHCEAGFTDHGLFGIITDQINNGFLTPESWYRLTGIAVSVRRNGGVKCSGILTDKVALAEADLEELYTEDQDQIELIEDTENEMSHKDEESVEEEQQYTLSEEEFLGDMSDDIISGDDFLITDNGIETVSYIYRVEMKIRKVIHNQYLVPVMKSIIWKR